MKRIICSLLLIVLIVSLIGCGNTKPVHPDKTSPPPLGEKTSQEIVDYSQYFNGINGCAVFYNAQDKVYSLYNEDLCNIQSSPCSTFKIISTLMGLKNGIISSENSTMNYNGTTYPVKSWNENLTLKDAFQNSCVWYYRQIIDQVGKEEVQKELNELQYGNCDISQWEGSNVNPLPDLNGFWLDSSLKISPIEQVNILRSIFQGNTEYSQENISTLKNIMLAEKDTDLSVYGKTGTGTSGNAWFVGFCENNSAKYYFAVYLDDKNAQVSGQTAKEIAIKIINSSISK
ncbi:penicillin-binding transpeptidase domain-containing protein [Aminipila terrae]|uniref:beta-lactamase n=1 Tax=Aminipila terrae TaxID=2697030 RepID=A0A6P1MQW9_9FIRM|nr:penicillin-binding transpeptidase domain-containing protein [Aminipila terrae]QHI73395.1 serine hydrolase [Aminipila terrae]